MINLQSTLRYQTGTATFIQLAVVVLLVLVNNFVVLIDACVSGSGCAITAVFSMFFIIMTGVWFMIISAIGYTAEERRSRAAAYVLIAGQLATIAVSWGFLKHPNNWFGAVSAFIVIVLSGWVIMLAWRLAQAKGGRIVTVPKQRERKRYVKKSDTPPEEPKEKTKNTDSK